MPTEDEREVGRSTDKPQDLVTPHEYQPISSDQNQPPASAPPQSQVSPAPRRFLAQPIETISRSSNVKQSALSGAKQSDLSQPEIHSEEPENRPTRRFLPEPIETTKASKRRSRSASEIHGGNSASQNKTSTAPRRFKPDLIETDTRSVRKGEPRFPQRHNAVGSSAPHTSISSDKRSWPDPNHHVYAYLQSESHFSYSNLLRRQQARRHSFRVPDLPSIPSDSSEDSDDSRPHSASTSPPGPSNKATQDLYASILPRQSSDGKISEFLLSLAARSAEKQLAEQALAAFPNEQVHETVDHFTIDKDDGDSDDGHVSNMKYDHVKSRRQSSADLSWELEYMRHHKEEAEMRIRAMVTSGQNSSSPERKKNDHSPPMLGLDIVLPRSASPEGTIFEHLSNDAGSHNVQDLCASCGGLWYAAPPRDDGKGAGLWMGTCCKDENQERQIYGLMPGIVTPMPHVDESGVSKGLSPSPSHINLDRLAASPGSHTSLKPASPNLQKAIESEFHDEFVTQIYNYLSLGYPCLARYYDYELSRISGIPIEDLRRDDLQTDARGYVVAPENDDFVDACTRWKALRLYIKEWARQEPGMAEEDTNIEGWGLPERRGSWAI
ncbi:uncharacterized protein N7479_009869 [Penicillium vulpinum]|nr:uncharacterized protein N7479_009869 [Penicillium vulpinum]KAJ5951456.1 hypothetical protein N7479_009869 [Penicillium vulpinum]